MHRYSCERFSLSEFSSGTQRGNPAVALDEARATALADGLRQTVEFYRAHFDQYVHASTPATAL